MVEIGRLERIDLRTIWRREDADFTVWLANNIDYLSEVLGFEITVNRIEESVGPYRVDIYGEDNIGNKVIIENQLEKTDHTHLGQLLTYLVNLEAKTAIWISPFPVEEHGHVVEWLNEITPDDVSIYLVKVEGLRMRGEQTIAPLFTVVEGPSAERKKIGIEKKEYAEIHQTQWNFWTQLLVELNAKSTFAQNLSPSREAWIGAALGASGISLNLVVSQRGVRVEVYINRGDRMKNKAAFDFLLERKTSIEEAVGTELGWERMDEKVTSRIRISKDGLNVAEQADWPEMTGFLVDMSIRLFGAFKEPVQQLRRSNIW